MSNFLPNFDSVTLLGYMTVWRVYVKSFRA